MTGRGHSTAFACSLSMLKARPVASGALGAALVVSLVSVCCGLGFLTAPWFACQLSYMQLSLLRGRSVERGPVVWRAMVLQGAAVVLLTTVGALALVAASFGSMTVEHATDLDPPAFSGLMGTGSLTALGAAGAAMTLVLPYQYAPLLLLEHRAGLRGALLESARMVFQAGVGRQLLRSAFAHGVQVVPALVALGAPVVAGDTHWTGPRAIIVAVPLLCASIPLGQGMLVASYVEVLDHTGSVATRPLPLRFPRQLVIAWVVVLVAPLLCSVMVSISLAWPARVARGGLQIEPGSGVVVGDVTVAEGEAPVLVPPATALEVRLTHGGALVVASDGGGAGSLPLSAPGSVTRARLVRVGSAFGIELHQGTRISHTWIDRAGVRLDDGLARRLFDRLSWQVLASLFCAMVATFLLSTPVLAALGRVRRAHQRTRVGPHAQQMLDIVQKRVVRRASVVAGGLLPAAIFQLCWGVVALVSAGA